MNIGNKIKELRKQRRITQEQLAGSIGISFQSVSKWETGVALPDITLAPKVVWDEYHLNIQALSETVRSLMTFSSW